MSFIVAAIRIASGDAMVWEDLEGFSRGHRIRTVSVIGEPKSGKTTLIAAIYASLCKGPIASSLEAGRWWDSQNVTNSPC